MTFPYTPTLTDVFGQTWELNRPGCPVRVKSLDLGSASYKFDEAVGTNQQGVTVVARNDDPNAMPFTVYVDSDKGDIAPLSRWRRANGRGMVEDRETQLMRLTIDETGRWADIRLLEWKNQPDWYNANASGRAVDAGTWRNDNSYWSGEELHYTFSQADLSSAVIFNDGDLSVWPRVRITGPITNPKFGLGAELLAISSVTSIPAGGYLDIQTDPDLWGIKDQTGVDRSWIGDRWHQKAIPTENTGQPVVLTGTGMTGATRLDIWLPQRYWSPL